MSKYLKALESILAAHDAKEGTGSANFAAAIEAAREMINPAPKDSEVCKFHKLPNSKPPRYVGVNAGQRLFVIPCNGGFTCLGFDVADRKRAAVAEWLGEQFQPAENGTVESYAAYLDIMARGAAHASATGKRCPAELTPALIGLEGKRVSVKRDGQEIGRFIVGKSMGWMPCHLEIANRNSSGGPAAYVPEGASVSVIGG